MSINIIIFNYLYLYLTIFLAYLGRDLVNSLSSQNSFFINYTGVIINIITFIFLVVII